MKTSSPHTPDPLTETPPEGRFCDLVLNGGVASGVVYPWAIVGLARRYRFKSIGGNSVGAMAASLAAAAEYGRCRGVADAFEPLRRLPLVLAEEDTQGRTKMLSLFQPSRPVRRLFDLFIELVARADEPGHTARPLRTALRVYQLWPLLCGLMLLAALLLGAALWQGVYPGVLLPLAVFAAFGVAAIVAVVLLGLLWYDLRALADNGYGLCTGKGQPPGGEGLAEWLHRGIQLSAGRGEHDPPLTFADLWAAPRFGKAGPAPLPGGLQPPDAGIDLQMFTSNVTQGRPVRLPLNDANTRLYYDPTEWAAFFPGYVLDALAAASTPYVPASGSDPDPAAEKDPKRQAQMARLRELPSGGMPIVVAARLSLSFPFLFSCVPVWAVDYEMDRDRRVLRPCRFSDGGLCSNFPVHLFDAAHPRWPTFAMLLDRRLRAFENQKVWLPLGEAEGRGDNWLRFVPGAEDDGRVPGALSGLLGLVGGLVLTMKDWNDRVTGRLPQVRNRMVRMALRPGEGQLNIAMPGPRILQMAHDYGTEAADRLLKAYAPDDKGAAKPAWHQHLYVRSMVELRALRRHLRRYALAVRSGADTVPLRELLKVAVDRKLLLLREGKVPPPGPPGELDPEDAAAIERAVAAVEALERELAACEHGIGRYRPKLEPELRLRPPM